MISGTSNGYKMLEEYRITRPNVKISIATKGAKATRRAYNAIDESDYVLIYAHEKGIKTGIQKSVLKTPIFE